MRPHASDGIRAACWPVAAALCSRGALPRAAAGRSDVADAAMNGDKAAVRTLIQKKADVNAPQVDGATALHWAVYRDDAELVDVAAQGRRQRRRPPTARA